ncbi:MAG TPA: BTAD domain-containing putative transcriptional regulator [Amycolatopsis sp.]|nr:BTAD domain-containing putative transcriptional regulator [Amycolatopsis sp.]
MKQRAALRSLVSRLRRALPDATCLRTGQGGYRLDLPGDAVDAHRFERLAGEGKRALRDGDPELAGSRLRSALELWRGDVAAGAASAVTVAAELDELRRTAIEDRIEADLACGTAPVRLVTELTELIAAHPLRERPRELLMRCLHADGRDAEALRAFEDYRALLAAEHSAGPGPELQETQRAILRAAPGTGPRGNLRATRTGFVGRDQERKWIRRRLARERMVTLAGPAGAGKSRLAAMVAADLAGRVTGGVWLVELSPAVGPDEVARTVAEVLNVREIGLSEGPHDPVDQLAGALASTETLIVLDDCEHALDGVARLADELLSRCPGLRILATSRQPLRIFGEALHQVPPLPERGGGAESPATRLFTDRAVAAVPGFVPTAATRDDVAEICRSLDGFPLAVELAAARLRTIPLGEVKDQLSIRLRDFARTGPAVSAAVPAAVAWTWELLDETERGHAARLAVFPAWFSAEAAAHLRVPRRTLDDLVDHALIETAEGRYRMVAAVRDHALRRLAETEDPAEVRAAHAAYFLGLAEDAAPRLRGAGQVREIRGLAAERDNLLAALGFATRTGDAATARRLGAALSLFWTVRDGPAVTAERLRTILELDDGDEAGDGDGDGTRPWVLAAYLVNALLANRAAEARVFAAGQAGDPAHPAGALVEALCSVLAGDPEAGLAALARFGPDDEMWPRGMHLLVRSMLHGGRDDIAAMCRDLEAAAAAFRTAGERWGLATSLTYLAAARSAVGGFEAAASAVRESIGLVRELGIADHAPRVWLARIRLRAGEQDRARRELLDVIADGASGHTAARARLLLADLARYRDDLSEAGRHLELAAHDLGDGAGEDALFRAGHGFLAMASGDLVSARRHLGGALALAVRTPDLPAVARAGVGIAQLAQRQGDGPAAARILGATRVLRGASDAFNPDVLELTRGLRTDLGDGGYASAYGQGRDLDGDHALELIAEHLRNGSGPARNHANAT